MRVEKSDGVRLDELRLTSCRFPLGGPWDRVEFFCGEPTGAGCSWCAEHRKRVFSRFVPQPKHSTPMSPRALAGEVALVQR
jgi:hypothetical protein